MVGILDAKFDFQVVLAAAKHSDSQSATCTAARVEPGLRALESFLPWTSHIYLSPLLDIPMDLLFWLKVSLQVSGGQFASTQVLLFWSSPVLQTVYKRATFQPPSVASLEQNLSDKVKPLSIVQRIPTLAEYNRTIDSYSTPPHMPLRFQNPSRMQLTNQVSYALYTRHLLAGRANCRYVPQSLIGG